MLIPLFAPARHLPALLAIALVVLVGGVAMLVLA